MKDLRFVGSSLDDLKTFPELARKRAGYELHLVQTGQDPTDWKPFGSVGKGVREIRIKLEGTFRVMYITNIGDKVYVLHAFQKKTHQTSQKDITLAQQRLKSVLLSEV